MRLRFPLFAVAAAALLMAACSDRNASDGGEETPTATSTPAATSTPSASPTATATQPTQPTPAGEAAFDGARAMEHIDELSVTIGPRVSGTDGEDSAVEYIEQQFEDAGYVVEIFEFAFQSDPYRSASVEADGEQLTAFAMTGSGTGKVTAASVFVGLADEAGIGAQELDGKIAVADRGTLRFSEKLDNVEERGALALVVINDEPGEFVGNLSGEQDIPAVTINGDLRVSMVSLAESGSELTVDVPGGTSTSSVNVIARVGEGDDCRILVGGHHDTVPGAPGAHDNASGTGAVIELARALAADGLDEGLCFATFGGEESGLNGSRALATEMEDDGNLPEVMVNIDANGVGSLVHLIGTPELTSRASALADTMGIESFVTELGPNFGSDHQSFEEVGVPVVFFTSDGLGNIHTPQDTIDTISASLVEAGGDLAYELIKQLLQEVATR